MVQQKLRIKECRFCNKNSSSDIDFKDIAMLKYFITEKGKILPRRITGCCSKHQRTIAGAIKRARHAALLPFQAEA
jgi:small subunit ribosomal protein S18